MSLRTGQVNNQYNLEHQPLLAYVYICVYNSKMRMRPLDGMYTIRVLHLELPTGFQTPWLHFGMHMNQKFKI